MKYYLTCLERLPWFALAGQHLLLHVLHSPGLSRLVVQSSSVVRVRSSESQTYPGHERRLGSVEQEQAENVVSPHCCAADDGVDLA